MAELPMDQQVWVRLTPGGEVWLLMHCKGKALQRRNPSLVDDMMGSWYQPRDGYRRFLLGDFMEIFEHAPEGIPAMLADPVLHSVHPLESA